MTAPLHPTTAFDAPPRPGLRGDALERHAPAEVAPDPDLAVRRRRVLLIGSLLLGAVLLGSFYRVLDQAVDRAQQHWAQAGTPASASALARTSGCAPGTACEPTTVESASLRLPAGAGLIGASR
jgi:hypothetical protein